MQTIEYRGGIALSSPDEGSRYTMRVELHEHSMKTIAMTLRQSYRRACMALIENLVFIRECPHPKLLCAVKLALYHQEKHHNHGDQDQRERAEGYNL